MLSKPSQWAIQHTGLQSQPLPGKSIVEIMGDSRILIERHSGITAFNEFSICIKTSFGYLRIAGSSLKIACMSKEQLIVTGNFDSVSLVRKG